MADSTNKTQIVKLHHLRPAPGAKTAKTRVGRGEGSKGKTAGRGTKGTKARYQVAAGFEGGQMPIHMLSLIHISSGLHPCASLHRWRHRPRPSAA